MWQAEFEWHIRLQANWWCLGR